MAKTSQSLAAELPSDPVTQRAKTVARHDTMTRLIVRRFMRHRLAAAS